VGGQKQAWRIFVVNPGATSTKLALFKNACCLRREEVPHASPAAGADSGDEAARRDEAVRSFLDAEETPRIDAVVARGGLLPRPAAKLQGGTYVVAEVVDGEIRVDEHIVRAITRHAEMPHASNLGIPMAAALARSLGVPAFVVDPVVVDEFVPEAEVSGYAGVTRRSVAHVLSVRATACRMAEKTGSPIEETSFVVAHLGSGITVAAVRAGRIVDDNIALLGEGPFTPQRAGTLPLRDVLDLCYSGRFTKEELAEELTLRGGLQSYLGEHRMEAIEKRIESGDETARAVVEAMVYQVAKTIGAMCVAAGCGLNAIVLTGGLARSERIVAGLKARLAHLVPVHVLAETPEMEAMALGALRVLSGRERAQRYVPPPVRGAGGLRHE